MFSKLGRNLKNLRWAVPLVALSFMACELDVADPSVVTEDELAGPSSVPTTINGVIGDLATSTEHYALYASLFTDEMILAGTFPTRVQVDERRVVFSNSSVTGEVEENLQVARAQSQRMIDRFEGFLGNEDFNQGDLLEGIAIGHYVDALSTMQLGQIYCNIALEGGGTPVPSDDAVNTALSGFEAAEGAAADAGLTEWESASILGQARAHLYLGEFENARDDAARVPSGHRLFVEFSNNDPEQFNKVFDLTWGSQNEVIRWTVGDGTQGERQSERFAEYDEFVDAGIINPSPDPDVFESFNSSILVHLQDIYDESSDDILLSTGIYADLIEIEADIRAGSGDPEADIDAIRESWNDRYTAERERIDFELPPINDRANAEFGDDWANLTLEQQLQLMAGEIARETWLTGTRQETLRRFIEHNGSAAAIDLYPEKPGDQVCWPVSEQEETGATP